MSANTRIPGRKPKLRQMLPSPLLTLSIPGRTAHRLIDNDQSSAYNARMENEASKISDQIRLAIEQSGMSRYRIAKETGIDPASLSRFMAGTTGLSTTTVDKLGLLLGLEIVVQKRRRRT